MNSGSPLPSLFHVCLWTHPRGPASSSLSEQGKMRITQQLFAQNRRQHASQHHRSLWALLRDAVGKPTPGLQARSPDSGMLGPTVLLRQRAGQIHRQGALERLKGWKRKLPSAFCSCQRLAQLLLPTPSTPTPRSSSSFPKLPLDPRCIFSSLHSAELAALPNLRPSPPQSLGLSPRGIL